MSLFIIYPHMYITDQSHAKKDQFENTIVLCVTEVI